MTAPRLFALVLAAGASRRFGSTKQLAELDGEALVARAMRSAIALCGSAVVLVTGKDWRAVAAAAAPGFFVVNPRYRDGMSTSIAAGMRVLGPLADGVLILLADQPLVTAGHLRSLETLWRENPDHIVASDWQDACGPPVIFPRSAFGDLLSLSGDAGARRIITDGRHPVLRVDFAAAAVDVDRPEDLERLAGREA